MDRAHRDFDIVPDGCTGENGLRIACHWASFCLQDCHLMHSSIFVSGLGIVNHPLIQAHLPMQVEVSLRDLTTEEAEARKKRVNTLFGVEEDE
jgi:hypothetical protein